MRKPVKGLLRRKDRPEWQYDFQVDGHRFSGTTGYENRKEAEKWLIAFRVKKGREIEQYAGDGVPMTFAVASSRWWNEAGSLRKKPQQVETFLAWLQREVGNGRRIDSIDNNLVSMLVARRREDGVTNATVNRSVLEPLRAILNRAALWGQTVQRIEWKRHAQKEPKERIREASDDEEAALLSAMRADFRAVTRFLLITGLRRAEACTLLWSDVDLPGRRFTVRGKGGSVNVLPISNAALKVLQGEVDRHKARVFTYTVRHSWGGRKGDLVPIAPDTLGTAFWRARKKANLVDFRLHDLRHTAATRLLRVTNNLKLVQKMLRHERITTTARYAHATDDDLMAGMNAANPVQSPVKNPSDETKEVLKPRNYKKKSA
jgi:integrase